MNFQTLINSDIWPQIRKLIPGIVKIQVPSLAGIWITHPDSNVCMVLREQDGGNFSVTASMSNIYVPNEQIIVENPSDLVDVISERYAEWDSIPTEGRMGTKEAEFEALEGTLTGKNLKAEFEDEDQETAVIEGAVTEIPVRLITL